MRLRPDSLLDALIQLSVIVGLPSPAYKYPLLLHSPSVLAYHTQPTRLPFISAKIKSCAVLVVVHTVALKREVELASFFIVLQGQSLPASFVVEFVACLASFSLVRRLNDPA